MSESQMRSSIFAFCGAAVLILLLHVPAVEAGPNWSYWIGPRGTGASNEVNLPDQWNPLGGEQSHLIWSAKVGGRSTPTSMNGRLYLLTPTPPEGNRKAAEKLVCLDAQSGKTLWEYGLDRFLTPVPAGQLASASVVCDPQSGNVFAQGAGGFLCCLNGETGTFLWDHSMGEEFGLVMDAKGLTRSPMIFETNVIVGGVVAGWGEQSLPAHRFLAMDKKNGMPVWSIATAGRPQMSAHSSLVLGTVDQELQMVCSGEDGRIHGFQPRTGRQLWSCLLSAQGIASTPLVAGNRVFCGYSTGTSAPLETGSVFCIDPTQKGDISKSGIVWEKSGFALSHSAPQLIDGRLYFVTNDAHLVCLNSETGDQIGEAISVGTTNRVNMLFADGKLYVQDVSGQGFILKPTPQGAEILFRYQFPQGEECHGSAIAVNGRIYLVTTSTTYCIGNADHPQVPQERAARLRETHVALDEKPAIVQVVPAESLLKPGTRQVFHARLYNSKGQYLRNPQPEELIYDLTGPGEINPTDGAYSIPSSHTQHDVGRLRVRFGELEGESRLRIVPALNWSFDFDHGGVPETWLGCAGRHVLLDGDLLQKLRQKDPLTGQLYLSVMSALANSAPQCQLDDSTPERQWTRFLEFMNIVEGTTHPKTMQEAKMRFEAGLNTLVEERVLASFNWSEWNRPTGSGIEMVPEPRLTLVQGKRPMKGNGVLAQLSAGTSGARCQVWMGSPQLKDYTIQADILRFFRKGKVSDAGVIAQLHPFGMIGEELQVQSWSSQLDPDRSKVSPEWKGETWYTMKFKVENKESTASLSGKIWPRGEAEPAEWSIAVEDVASMSGGSPGLFGAAQDGELFYDNVIVTSNSAR